MKLSRFGEKFSSSSGIVSLMDDLGSALNDQPDMLFMGGGNPAHIPAIETTLQKTLADLAADANQCRSLLSIYQPPQGDRSFRLALASFFNKHYGWAISEHNIALANGSQSAFFILYNLLAGTMTNGEQGTIHLPLIPEYIGYADTGITSSLFTATTPSIEYLDNRLFKYHVDFSKLSLPTSTTALCVSRPTNPTGNVLTNNEIEHLDQLAKQHKIPLIIDAAYGLPFPNILFTKAEPLWNENVILSLSLSKLGLPGVRTGIIIANAELITAFANANTITSLACGNLGPAMGKKLLESNQLLTLSQQSIRPFYEQRALQTTQWFHKALAGLPYHIHKPEGAIFLWLWLENLPISSQALYQRLKKRGLLIIPGEAFFIGADKGWQHSHECIRVSYAQDEKVVKAGINIIAEELKILYGV